MTSISLRRAVRHALLLSSMAASVATLAPAMAADDEVGEVVVTGSRILRPNLESTVPITSINSDELFQTGNTSVGDLLDNMPALRSTFSQSNSSRFLGTAGLNLLDLRGLGTQRTLVLVNGRRHVAGDILNNGVSPDVNTFPTDLIERVDIITGGSSAVYGSDAIAGVANFILKKNFEGLQLRGQGGESYYHDAKSYYASALWGTNFSDNRGNVAINAEYAKQEPFFAKDRPSMAKNGNFVVVDTDPATSPNGSDGVPDRTYYNDIRSTTIAMGGLVQISPAAGFTPCGIDSQGATYRCTLLFNPDGTVVPQTGQRIGLAPNGNFQGGNGTSGREDQSLGIFPKLTRYSVNLIGHLELSEAFDPFIEAKYVRTDSLSFGTPAFFQGTTIDAFQERPRWDNPFLSASAKTSINAARAAAGLGPITGSTRFSLFKNLNDLGYRQEEAKRETTRIVVGAGGKLSSDWSYEASVNYGKFKESTLVLGNMDVQRFTLAMDAAQTSSGNIVCRSQIDPTTASVFLDPSTSSAADVAFATSRLANDIATCVPLNPFGSGNITPAMRNYLLQNTTSVAQIEQFDVNAFVTGNTGAWFSLPAGPIGVAFGVEYRTEKNKFDADRLVASGLTFYNAIPPFEPPTFKVKEVYSELRLPLLKNIVAADELTLSLAGRASDYGGSTGKVYAYNGGLDWAPVHDLRFRAGFARAVRAPNLSDLFSPLGQNFTPAPNDPCSKRNIGTGSATRAANCAAAGIPTSYDFVYTQSLELRSGGNPNLQAETSDSVTVGFVFQPSFIPDFSLSVDYYDIEVDNVITSPSAQQILNACYDSPTLGNQFCGLFQRVGANGLLPGGGAPTKGEVPFQVVETSLQQITLNYAKRTARGVDVEISHKASLGGFGTLGTRFVYTYALNRNDYLDPAFPNKADQILQELGDPKHAFNLSFEYVMDKFNAGWKTRYISKMVLNTYENLFSVQGRPPENLDYADVQFYPSVWYHDMHVGYDVVQNVNVYAGIDNVFNRIPPLGLTGAGAGSAIYEPRGRFFYIGVKAKVL